MIALESKYLTSLMALLDHNGAKYRIEMPDGRVYGTLEVAAPRSSSRKPLQFPRGTVQAHYLPYVENMKNGEAVAVPFGPFGGNALRSSISSYCTRTWGSEASMTSVNHKTQCVEVLRIA
jgi:hypothetical protein